MEEWSCLIVNCHLFSCQDMGQVQPCSAHNHYDHITNCPIRVKPEGMKNAQYEIIPALAKKKMIWDHICAICLGNEPYRISGSKEAIIGEGLSRKCNRLGWVQFISNDFVVFLSDSFLSCVFTDMQGHTMKPYK